MEKGNLKSYSLDTELTGYLPLPRQLLDMDLPATAVLIYGVLLDRGTLSRKNHYADETGQVYVIYPVDRLAETLHISDTAVKRHLRELEAMGLIRRTRENRQRASSIYLSLPDGSIREPEPQQNAPAEGAKMSPLTGRKVPANNRKQQRKYSNDYQYGEDESL